MEQRRSGAHPFRPIGSPAREKVRPRALAAWRHRVCSTGFRAVAVLALALTCLFVLVLAKEYYDAEDSLLNGAARGAPGLVRVRLHCNSCEQAHAADGSTVYAHSLRKLRDDASALFAMEFDRIYTSDGSAVSEFFVQGAGRSCLFDGSRCVYDGSDLFAVRRGEPFVPPQQDSTSPTRTRQRSRKTRASR